MAEVLAITGLMSVAPPILELVSVIATAALTKIALKKMGIEQQHAWLTWHGNLVINVQKATNVLRGGDKNPSALKAVEDKKNDEVRIALLAQAIMPGSLSSRASLVCRMSIVHAPTAITRGHSGSSGESGLVVQRQSWFRRRSYLPICTLLGQASAPVGGY